MTHKERKKKKQSKPREQTVFTSKGKKYVKSHVSYASKSQRLPPSTVRLSTFYRLQRQKKHLLYLTAVTETQNPVRGTVCQPAVLGQEATGGNRRQVFMF